MKYLRGRVLLTAIRKAWPAGLCVVGLVLSLVIGRLFTSSISGIVRYASMLLQIFGIALVAWGLSELRQLFKRPSLLSRVGAWFSHLRSAFGPQQYITGSGHVMAGG